MKTPVSFFLAGLIALSVTAAQARDLLLNNGTLLRDAKAVAVNGDTITIRHAGGISQIARVALPDNWEEQCTVDAGLIASERARHEHDTNLREARERAAESERLARLERLRAERDRSEPQAGEEAPQRRPQQWEPNSPEASPEQEIYDRVAALVKEYARNYFTHDYQTGSGATLNLDVWVELESVEEMPGWPDQRRVKGRAAMRYFDSKGWGSFARTARVFEAITKGTRRPQIESFNLLR